VRAVLIGAGTLPARRLTRDLTEDPEVSSVVIVDRDPATAELVAGISPKALPVAVSSSAASIAEVSEGADVVISFLGDDDAEISAANGAMDAGVAFLSASGRSEVFEAIGGNARSRGSAAPVLLGCGWTPALTSVMARLGALEVNGAREIEVAWVVSGWGKDSAESIEEVARALTGTASVFDDGSWRRELAGANEEQVYFPEPVGWREVRLADGIEPLSLPASLSGVQKIIVRGGFTERFVERANKAAQTLHTSLGFSARLSSTIGKVAGASSGAGGAARGWSAARVDVVGTNSEVVSYGVVDQLPNLISAPLITMAMLVYRGELKESGVHSAGSAVDASAFLSALAVRGVRVAKLERGGHVDRF
jgi:hypothetical protein